MDDQTITRIKGYVATINLEAAKPAYDALLTYVVNEVIERMLIYLNDTTLDMNLERIVARIVSGIFNQTYNTMASTEQDAAVSSISDNGQSISYANSVKSYLADTDDNELFAGAAKLLAPYRRINVVSRQSQTSNSQGVLR